MSNDLIFDALNHFSADDQTFLDSFLKDNINSPSENFQEVNDLGTISTTKTFEEMSAFANSPFGQNWHKYTVYADWQNDKFNQSPPQPQWIYHFEKDSDGKKLIELYQHDKIIPPIYGSDTDNLTDISVYYETDDSYNSLGSICFVKINEALTDYLLTYSNASDWLAKEIAANEGNGIDAARIKEAIDYELETRGGIDILAKIGVKLLLKLAELLRSMQYPENAWNPALKNYDPVLPVGGIDNAIKKWNNFKKDSDRFLATAQKICQWLADYLPGAGEIIHRCIDAIIHFFSSIIQFVDDIIQQVAELVKILKLVNAFLCGVINECLEMAAGFMDLLALLLSLSNKTERAKVKEAIENAIETYLRQPTKIIEQLKTGFEQLKHRYSSDTPEYQQAYYLGEDVVVVVTLIEAVWGIIKTIKNLPRTFKKLETWVKKSVEKIKAIDVSKINEELKVLRFKLLDRTIINSRWRIYIRYSELTESRIFALQKMREDFGLLKSNIATLKVKVITKEAGIIIKEYIAHSGRGMKIPKSTGAPQLTPVRDFIDYQYTQNRWYDSENKMLVELDKDLKPYTVLQMTMEWESTFTPLYYMPPGNTFTKAVL